jgi:hypothetical protein
MGSASEAGGSACVEMPTVNRTLVEATPPGQARKVMLAKRKLASVACSRQRKSARNAIALATARTTLSVH